MRIAVFFLSCIFANISCAVGWEEVSKENSEKRGFFVRSGFNQSMGCYDFNVTLPSQLFFDELGEREFWSARYKVVSEKSKGWQLTSKGTQVDLPAILEKENVKISALCLSNSDLAAAYLSVVFGGPQGTPPIVVLLALGDYK